jgi:hypothetical protein
MSVNKKNSRRCLFKNKIANNWKPLKAVSFIPKIKWYLLGALTFRLEDISSIGSKLKNTHKYFLKTQLQTIENPWKPFLLFPK